MRRLIPVAGAVLFLLGSGCGHSQGSLLLLDELPEVGSITIVGNETFDDGTLKDLMTLRSPSITRPFQSDRFSDRQLEADVLAILTFYMRHGYLRAREVKRQITPVGKRVDLTIEISEGAPVAVAGVRVLDAGTGTADALKETGVDLHRLRRAATLKAGRPFDPFRLTDDRRSLERSLGDQGFLLAAVRPDVQFEGDRAWVFFRVRPGDKYTIGGVEIRENRAILDRVIRKELELTPGDPYRRKRVIDAQRRLLQTGYFTDVRWDTTRVDRARHTVVLDFRVHERRIHWVEGGLGVNSQNLVRATGTWGTRNLWRSGIRFALVTRTDVDLNRRIGSYVDEHETQAFLTLSRLAGTRWEGRPGVSYTHDREIDYRQNIVSAGVAFRRPLAGLRDQVVLAVENRWVNNDARPAAILRDVQLSRKNYQTRLISGRVQLDSRDDFFDPARGSVRDLSVEFAGGALGGNNGFRKATGSVSVFRRILRGPVVLAGRLQAGGIDATDATTTVTGDPVLSEVQLIPVEDRYVLGGANTVRGFAQDQLDGRKRPRENSDRLELERGGILSLLGNVEARIGLFSRISVVGFLDAGNVWQDDGDLSLERFVPHVDSHKVDPEDLRYSFGGGLRVSTPVGPVRLDYARKWNIPAVLAEGKDKWHVSLGHAF